MKSLIKIDEAAIFLAEKFSHWFQRQTGKTNFFLAKITLAIFLLTAVNDLIVDVLNAKTKGAGWELSSDLLGFVALLGMLFWFYDSEEYAAIRRLGQGIKNPLKIHPTHRLIRLCVLVFSWFVEGLEIGIWLSAKLYLHKDLPSLFPPWYKQVQRGALISWAYFSVCDPLPPCNGKVTNWIGSLLARSTFNTGQ